MSVNNYLDKVLMSETFVKITEFEFPKGEYFGWYNPKTGEIYHEHTYGTFPKKPKGNWYSWHNHPRGTDGHPSEIDLLDMVEQNDKGPNYSYGNDGLYSFEIKDMAKAKIEYKKIKKEFNIKDFKEFIEKHNKMGRVIPAVEVARRIGAVIKRTTIEKENTDVGKR